MVWNYRTPDAIKAEIHFKSAGRASESDPKEGERDRGVLTEHFLCLATSLRVDKRMASINSS